MAGHRLSFQAAVVLNDLAQGFGAKVNTEYATEGFCYGLTVPLTAIAEIASPLTEAPAAA